MPIHVSWKSMAQSMKKKYPEGNTKCRDFTDGKNVCMSEKAWSNFFGSISKMGGKPEKERSQSVEESLERQTDELIEWYLNKSVQK